MKATAILLNYKKPDSLRQTIQSIRNQTVECEIIVFDNSGAQNDFDCDLYIQSSRNLHCKARFMVASFAAADYIFTLDDDTTLSRPTAIEECIKYHKKQKSKKTILGSDFYNIKKTLLDGWSEVDYIKGRFMFFHKEYLLNVVIGFFDLINTKGTKKQMGLNSTLKVENWIGVDDLSFQLAADKKLVYNIGFLKDQPCAKIGLHNNPDHAKIRALFMHANL